MKDEKTLHGENVKIITLKQSNGQKYKGNVKDGKFNGRGLLELPDYEKYYADDWKDGILNGRVN